MGTTVFQDLRWDHCIPGLTMGDHSIPGFAMGITVFQDLGRARYNTLARLAGLQPAPPCPLL